MKNDRNAAAKTKADSRRQKVERGGTDAWVVRTFWMVSSCLFADG
jgi:hypothetical protein